VNAGTPSGGFEDLLRTEAPQVLGALVRRYGHFELAEDAVQEALAAAVEQWPAAGVPDNPRAWLVTVASRRLTDLLRADQARRRREGRVARWSLASGTAGPPDERSTVDVDDTLLVLFLCCHPSLSPASQIALTLRAVGGLTTAEVARAFLVPDATMTRRITRAKRSIEESGIPFAAPPLEERTERLEAVLHVIYLIFNEGYAATSGPDLQRTELAVEAVRLARLLHRLLPDDAEAAGLLALLLLTDARRPARTAPDGTPIPMAEQDRSRWDTGQIAEGVALISEVLPRGQTGPYQLQAAIAAIHDEGPDAAATDWAQIAALYDRLMLAAPSPVVALNHAVALAMFRGPHVGLARLDELAADDRLTAGHRFHTVRAHLLEMAGDEVAAQQTFLEAARRATSVPHQRYLHRRAARLALEVGPQTPTE
jgi:RNA polymerase sigma factor (sigma-70 family)